MDEAQALAYINEIGWRGSKPGLARTRALLERMGNPEKTLRFVHVAGTNGKGSVCAMLSSVLHAAGYRTGLFLSPHLVRFHERMRVDGGEITGQELVELTEYVRSFADGMTDDPPTQFELMTAIAFAFFQRRQCEIVVLEVGMGGLLDSTNVIQAPEVAVITSIGYDHMEQLGRTLEEIASAKAGILKAGSSAVLSGQTPAVQEVVASVCKRIEIPLRVARMEDLRGVQVTVEGTRFTSPAFGELKIPLLGEHQAGNAATALAAVESLRMRGWKISDEAVREGLAGARWPGRFEIVRRAPYFIIDGGHNPQGMGTTARTLQTLFPGKKVTFVTGAMADKDIDQMYGQIAPLASRFFTVTPDNPRALLAPELAERLHALFAAPCKPFGEVAGAVREAVRLEGPDGIVCTVGSLYLAGAVRAQFGLD